MQSDGETFRWCEEHFPAKPPSWRCPLCVKCAAFGLWDSMKQNMFAIKGLSSLDCSTVVHVGRIRSNSSPSLSFHLFNAINCDFYNKTHNAILKAISWRFSIATFWPQVTFYLLMGYLFKEMISKSMRAPWLESPTRSANPWTKTRCCCQVKPAPSPLPCPLQLGTAKAGLCWAPLLLGKLLWERRSQWHFLEDIFIHLCLPIQEKIPSNKAQGCK